MMDMHPALRHGLADVARALDEHGVTWALGGSLMLLMRGIADTARDIDLMVIMEDAGAADAALSAIGIKDEAGERGIYETAFFASYSVGGVSVDLIAGFVICHPALRYAYPLNPVHFDYAMLDGHRIPLSPAEDWYVLYQLMPGRDARVRQLDAYLAAHGARRDVVAARLSERLPEAVRTSLSRLPLKEDVL